SKNGHFSVFLALFCHFFVQFLCEKSFLGLIFAGYIAKHLVLHLGTILALCLEIPRENDEKPRKIAILACFWPFFVTFCAIFVGKELFGVLFSLGTLPNTLLYIWEPFWHFVSKNSERKRRKTSKNSHFSVFLALFCHFFVQFLWEKSFLGLI